MSSDHSTMEDSTAASPAPKRRMEQEAAQDRDARDINLKATCDGKIARLLLSDIVQSPDPSSDIRTLLTQLTLDRFIQCCSEDLELKPLEVTLRFMYEGAQFPTKLTNDRQLRGAMREVIDGAGTDPTFEFTADRTIPLSRPPFHQLLHWRLQVSNYLLHPL